MTRAQAGARLRDGTLEPPSGPGIDDLRSGAVDQAPYFGGIAHQGGIKDRRIVARRALARWTVFQPATFGLPFLETAVQYAHLFMTHGPEHPPHPCRRVEPFACVGNDMHTVADDDLILV